MSKLLFVTDEQGSIVAAHLDTSHPSGPGPYTSIQARPGQRLHESAVPAQLAHLDHHALLRHAVALARVSPDKTRVHIDTTSIRTTEG